VSAGFRVALFFATLFAAGAINTAFVPLWFADRGLSPIAIGQILGAASLLRVFAGPGWGSVADRLGRRRPVLLVAALTAAAAALLYLPLYGFMPLLLVSTAQGVASSALNPLIDSLALALAQMGRMQYGPVRSFGSMSYMVASAGTGWLLSLTGTWAVPWLLAGMYGAAAAVTPMLPEATRAPAAPRAWAGLRLLANRPFLLIVLASALIQGAHAAYYGFAPLLWRSQGFSDSVIGLLIAEGIIAEVALFAWGRPVIERLGPAGLTACAAGASLIRWGITACAPPLAVLATIQLLHAATFGMQHLSAMLVLSRAMPPERAATAQALHAALGFGAPTGLLMLLAGVLYARFDGLAFLAMAGVGGSALLLVRPLARAVRIISSLSPAPPPSHP
jgi:MFS transporter, PPP family, 3-phenylpropionic acid transporter